MLVVARGLSNGLGDLQSLELENNPLLGDLGMAALADGLRSLKCLKWLNITKTDCGDAGLVSIVDALPVTLVSLSFSDNKVGDLGWAALANAIQRLPDLGEIRGLSNMPGIRTVAANAWAREGLLQMRGGGEPWTKQVYGSIDRAAMGEPNSRLLELMAVSFQSARVMSTMQWSPVTEADAHIMREDGGDPFRRPLAFSVICRTK